MMHLIVDKHKNETLYMPNHMKIFHSNVSKCITLIYSVDSILDDKIPRIVKLKMLHHMRSFCMFNKQAISLNHKIKFSLYKVRHYSAANRIDTEMTEIVIHLSTDE